MTDEQKKKLEQMRADQCSYGEIAAAIGLSRDAVKKHCQRHRLLTKPEHITSDPEQITAALGEVITDQALRCKQCQKEIPAVHGRRQPIFCSTECRRVWWKNHPDAGHPKKFYTIVCKGCGVEFRSYGNANRKYCSHECYINDRFKGGESDDKTKDRTKDRANPSDGYNS